MGIRQSRFFELWLVINLLHCVLGQGSWLSQCFSSPSWILNGNQQINAGDKPYDKLPFRFHAGRGEEGRLLVASCYGNQRMPVEYRPLLFSFCSTPGGNTISAAEQTCVLISSLARYDCYLQVVRLCQGTFKFLVMQEIRVNPHWGLWWVSALNVRTWSRLVSFLDRHIPQAATSMKEGKWDRKKVWSRSFFETQF